mmetsp:Transcript_17709/g.24987  ORF Transcript_17709/g.24987 Transcript_17709/m.24987 type:complete len:580 (-) Transcript_17709:132-1871(-)
MPRKKNLTKEKGRIQKLLEEDETSLDSGSSSEDSQDGSCYSSHEDDQNDEDDGTILFDSYSSDEEYAMQSQDKHIGGEVNKGFDSPQIPKLSRGNSNETAILICTQPSDPRLIDEKKNDAMHGGSDLIGKPLNVTGDMKNVQTNETLPIGPSGDSLADLSSLTNGQKAATPCNKKNYDQKPFKVPRPSPISINSASTTPEKFSRNNIPKSMSESEKSNEMTMNEMTKVPKESKSDAIETEKVKSNSLTSVKTNSTQQKTPTKYEISKKELPKPKVAMERKKRKASPSKASSMSMSIDKSSKASEPAINDLKKQAPSSISAEKISSKKRCDIEKEGPKTKNTPKKRQKQKSFQQEIIDHLLIQMKPFTLKSLATEMRTTDVALNHLMLSLIDKNVIRKKEFSGKGGKRVKELYWLNLENVSKVINESGKSVQIKDLNEAKSQLKSLIHSEHSLLQKIQMIEGQMSKTDLDETVTKEEELVKDLKEKIAQTHKSVVALEKRCNSTSSGAGSIQRNMQISTLQLKIKINSMLKEWKKRKEICVDFVENVADAMEKKIKDVYQLLEVETDEMMKVTMPKKHDT